MMRDGSRDGTENLPSAQGIRPVGKVYEAWIVVLMRGEEIVHILGLVGPARDAAKATRTLEAFGTTWHQTGPSRFAA